MPSLRVARTFSALCLLSLGCADSDEPSQAKEEPAAGLRGELCPLDGVASPVAVRADGLRVAYVSCAGKAPEVVVHDLEADAAVTVGEAVEGTSIEWLLDDKHVLFGTEDERFVAPIDGSREPVSIASGALEHYRIFRLKFQDTDFRPRLLVQEDDGGVKRISVRSPDDGYAEPRVVREDERITSDLSQVSGSGRNLIITVDEDGVDSGYIKQPLDEDGDKPVDMPFGPKSWAMAPVGLGDTHNYALHDDELVRIELKTGIPLVIVPSGSGLLEGTHHLIPRELEAGFQHIYFIVDGKPSRRPRQISMGETELPPIETIAEANAVAQRLTPDDADLLYLSDGALYAVDANGGDSRLLVTADDENARVAVTYSSIDKSKFRTRRELAYTPNIDSSDGALYRVSLRDDSAVEVSGDYPARPDTVRYDGLGDAILYLSDDTLVRIPRDADQGAPIAESVEAFWPIPGSADVLVARNGILERLALGDEHAAH